MNKRDRLIGVLLILSVLFFQYLWLLLSVLLLVVLGILIFDTRYDRYALVMVVLVMLLYLSTKFMFYETYLVPTKSMLPALNSNVTVQGEKWRYGGIFRLSRNGLWSRCSRVPVNTVPVSLRQRTG